MDSLIARKMIGPKQKLRWLQKEVILTNIFFIIPSPTAHIAGRLGSTLKLWLICSHMDRSA